VIVDANVAVYWAIPGPHAIPATAVMSRADLAAPSLILPETANALINHARAGNIPAAQIGEIVAMIRTAIKVMVSDAELVQGALEIAIAHNHKVDDCLYLALALQRREPLATADRRLAALAETLSIPTELIEPAL